MFASELPNVRSTVTDEQDVCLDCGRSIIGPRHERPNSALCVSCRDSHRLVVRRMEHRKEQRS